MSVRSSQQPDTTDKNLLKNPGCRIQGSSQELPGGTRGLNFWMPKWRWTCPVLLTLKILLK